MQHSLIILTLMLATLSGCTTTGGSKPKATGSVAAPAMEEGDWETMDDLKQIAAMRKEVNKPHLSLDKVIVLRLTGEDGKRVEITSLGPSVIGFHNGGAPAEKTVFTFSPERDRIILFSQDVPHWRAFRNEIMLDSLTAGSTFRFPVVQDSGAVIPRTFTVEQVIVQ